MRTAQLILVVATMGLSATVAAAHSPAEHAKTPAPAKTSAPAKAVAPAATAMPPKPAQRSESVTLDGEFVDPQCYFTHDSRGPAHAACAAKCAKGGQGLAFLDDANGNVYPLIAKSHGASQNEGLVPHLGKIVRVKGIVFRKGNNSVLQVQSVTPVVSKTR